MAWSELLETNDTGSLLLRALDVQDIGIAEKIFKEHNLVRGTRSLLFEPWLHFEVNQIVCRKSDALIVPPQLCGLAWCEVLDGVQFRGGFSFRGTARNIWV